MTKTRNRAKQTTTLKERLARYSADLKEQANTAQLQTEQVKQLHKRIGQCETAMQLNESLNAGR